MILIAVHGIWIIALIDRDFDALDVHKRGFDLVFLVVLWTQVLIRNFMISLKYGTFTEKQWSHLFVRVWTKDENYHEQILNGWVLINPDLLLLEVGRSQKRLDSDPNYLTFRSFNNMGSRTQ
jgi:hypothetical protein